LDAARDDDDYVPWDEVKADLGLGVSRYEVEVARRAVKSLARLPRREQQRIRAAIDLLADEPRPPGCVAFTGEDRAERDHSWADPLRRCNAMCTERHVWPYETSCSSSRASVTIGQAEVPGVASDGRRRHHLWVRSGR